MIKTGARLLHDALVREGIGIIFGIPGSDVLPFYDEMHKSKKVKHFLFRHEQASVHAADGFFRVSGQLATSMSTSGPGATNQITGIATAWADSIPLIAINMNTNREDLGKGSFQEVDIISLTKPITKKNFLVMKAGDFPRVVSEAVATAMTIPRGPVLINVPKDVFKEKAAEIKPVVKTIIENQPPSQNQPFIKKVFKWLSESERPVFLVGEGLIASEQSTLFCKLARKMQIPVATTVSGVGVFPENHKLSLQVAGVLGTPYANSAIQESDLLLVLGASLESRTTANTSSFAKKAKIVHVDIDAKQCGKFVSPSLCISDDIEDFLIQLNNYLSKNSFKTRKKWLKSIKRWKTNCPISYSAAKELIKPQELIEELNKLVPEAKIFAGNGQHKYWAMRHFVFKKPRQFNVSSRFGCMGFAFPAAIGAKIAKPKDTVIAILGDGDFQVNIQELATVVENKIDLKIIVVNNHTLGAVRQHQHFDYDNRFFGTYYNLDLNFAKIAKAYGFNSIRITKPKEIKPALQKMLESKSPFLLEALIPKNEYLLPKISVSDSLDKASCLIDLSPKADKTI
jgi:acetolactate synthase I/II/III large subunit